MHDFYNKYNREATQKELIEQLKSDKKHEMEWGDQMLQVIQKSYMLTNVQKLLYWYLLQKILDSSVQEQLVQTILRKHNELPSGKDDLSAAGHGLVTPDESLKNNLSHKGQNSQ